MTKNDRIKKYSDLMATIYKSQTYSISVEDLDKLGFFEAPASTKYHGAYEGGLFDHSFATAEALADLTKKFGLEWQRDNSPYIVGLFHDICKCDNYVVDIESDKYIYNPDIIIPGHGEKSVIMLQKYILLNEEEIACIRWHMGAYDSSDMWKYYDNAILKYPNVLYTHTADMIASKIKGI